MSLIQRNAVPLFILIAVIAVGVGVFASASPFAFGEEPTGCDAAAVGISIYTTDEEGNPVTVVSNGDVVTYRVTLSIPELPAGETACNYLGGILDITLPDGNQVAVAGTEDTGEIPTVQVGAPFTAQSVSYTVNQDDAVNGELTVRANYSGGSSLSVAEGEQSPEAAASVSNVLRMTPPSISIEKITTTPLIFHGQTASFSIKVVNTGGYRLTNVTVSDPEVDSCDGIDFGNLAVGEEKSVACSTLLDGNINNEAQATASVPGGPPAGMETITSGIDSATVTVEDLTIGITVDTTTPHIRLGNLGELVITVVMPHQTAVNDVTVTVAEAPQCDNFWDLLPAGAEETYTCNIDTDPAIEGSLPLGTTTITGSVTGYVPDVPLSADTSVDVSVFSLALNITIDPKEQTIRDGDMASFTVNVSNQGDDVLSNVMVTNETVPNCDAVFETLSPGEVQTYDCVSDAVSDDMTTIINVVATAADGAPVDAMDSAIIIILRPSTALEVAEVNTTVLRLVVQTLKITETNDGDTALTDVYVEVQPTNVILNKDSVEFVGGDTGDDGIMDVGETWEWRLVTVAVAGDAVFLGGDAASIEFEAIGHGIDQLGGDVTFPGDAEERGVIEVPIVTQ